MTQFADIEFDNPAAGAVIDKSDAITAAEIQGYQGPDVRGLIANQPVRQFLDKISDVITQYDTEAKAVWTNRAGRDFLRKFGPSDFVGRSCRELFYAVKQHSSDCPVTRTIETNCPQQQKVYFSDASTRFVRCYPVGSDDDKNFSVWTIALKVEHHDSREDITAFYKRVSQLSRREKQVMYLVADGLANKVIAARLGISPRTVEIHRARMMSKLGIDSVAELVRYISHGEKILDPFDSSFFCI